eukprot:maker-scaffold153_size302544-snap-gene-1.11 protein:Tk03375 transcript:maker-scaffold153_size302544-snap-gene-1.11-mRNA-1 annotation:"predicted protein"
MFFQPWQASLGRLSRGIRLAAESRALSGLAQYASFELSVPSAQTPSRDPRVENLRLRRHLALSYRLMETLNLNEGACNHISVMAPAQSGVGEVMLLAPGYLPDGASLHWSEVNASSLIGLNTHGDVVEDGCWGGRPELSAACIHLGVRNIQPHIKVLMHIHPPHSTALGCLKDPRILPIHQNSLRFIARTAYHQEYAFPDAITAGEDIGKNLQEKDVMIMCNHGIIVAAKSVAIAFDDTYYLERACMSQMMALSACGGNRDQLAIMDKAAEEESIKGYTPEMIETYSNKHFYSWWNRYVHSHPQGILIEIDPSQAFLGGSQSCSLSGR